MATTDKFTPYMEYIFHSSFDAKLKALTYCLEEEEFPDDIALRMCHEIEMTLDAWHRQKPEDCLTYSDEIFEKHVKATFYYRTVYKRRQHETD